MFFLLVSATVIYNSTFNSADQEKTLFFYTKCFFTEKYTMHMNFQTEAKRVSVGGWLGETVEDDTNVTVEQNEQAQPVKKKNSKKKKKEKRSKHQSDEVFNFEENKTTTNDNPEEKDNRIIDPQIEKKKGPQTNVFKRTLFGKVSSKKQQNETGTLKLNEDIDDKADTDRVPSPIDLLMQNRRTSNEFYKMRKASVVSSEGDMFEEGENCSLNFKSLLDKSILSKCALFRAWARLSKQDT